MQNIKYLPHSKALRHSHRKTALVLPTHCRLTLLNIQVEICGSYQPSDMDLGLCPSLGVQSRYGHNTIYLAGNIQYVMVINLLGDQEVSVKYIRRGVKHRVGYFHANVLLTKRVMTFIFEV